MTADRKLRGVNRMSDNLEKAERCLQEYVRAYRKLNEVKRMCNSVRKAERSQQDVGQSTES